MAKTINTTQNGEKISFVIPDDAMRISVDGFGPALIGFPFSTVSLCQQQITATPGEQERKVIATLQMPTTAFLELAQTIVKALQENKPGVEESFEQMKKFINGASI